MFLLKTKIFLNGTEVANPRKFTIKNKNVSQLVQNALSRVK
ncbi:hypothetical protein FACS1894202_14580 [Clostridia bacterium]|nr:hypothetical protein FACS1894202_14580 [Clostridia bacterium]